VQEITAKVDSYVVNAGFPRRHKSSASSPRLDQPLVDEQPERSLNGKNARPVSRGESLKRLQPGSIRQRSSGDLATQVQRDPLIQRHPQGTRLYKAGHISAILHCNITLSMFFIFFWGGTSLHGQSPDQPQATGLVGEDAD
jgi:hypothetical protein